jgi:phosphomannomutase
VLHNLLTSKSVSETINAHGAIPQVTKVGHSLIKDQMASTAAVFGGEHSAHYYFREFWGADNGMLAAMHLISELGTQDRAMSEISVDYTPYFASGEINSTVADAHKAQSRVAAEFEGAFLEELDGKTYSQQDGEVWWWCNIRSSNTEPLLRLNVESNQESVMHQIRDRALAAITSRA